MPGPPPQSGGQSARAIAITGLLPESGPGTMTGNPTAAATSARTDKAQDM
ncbi:hypothetical protein [Mycobacteroides chelonae]